MKSVFMDHKNSGLHILVPAEQVESLKARGWFVVGDDEKPAAIVKKRKLKGVKNGENSR